MAFTNSLECKFSNISNSPDRTDVRVRIYRISDNGVNSNGDQLYTRVLFRELKIKLNAGWDRDRVLRYFRTRLSEINTTSSLGYAVENQICTL